MINLQEIGERLRLARERTGLTQDQVASFLEISRGQISYYENGRREIDLTTLARLASLYGHSLHFFLDGPSKTPGGDQELLIAFRAEGLEGADLETIAWIKRFTRNLYELNQIVDGEG